MSIEKIYKCIMIKENNNSLIQKFVLKANIKTIIKESAAYLDKAVFPLQYKLFDWL